MKYLILILLFVTTSLKAQNSLFFNKKNTQCENKWVAAQINKDSTYNFGYIYVDPSAGLTLNVEGSFKIDKKNNKFIPIKSADKEVKRTIVRLNPNNYLFAEIPESKFEELEIEKEPKWMKFYKEDETTVNYFFKKGYQYNAWNESEKALVYLEKANKMDSKFKGLQTELAFSYNALNQYDKAEICLLKALKANPTDCYTFKELAFTYTKQVKFDKVADVIEKMKKACKQNDYILETAYNLAYEYYLKKDINQFSKWKVESEKWSKPNSQYLDNLGKMEAELKVNK